jgi:hypothetical protein
MEFIMFTYYIGESRILINKKKEFKMWIRIILDNNTRVEVEVNSFEEISAIAEKHRRWEYV